MPRLAIAAQSIGAFGGGVQNVALTTPVAADDCYIDPDPNVCLLILNGDVASKVVTIAGVADPINGRSTDISLTVPAAAGGFPGVGVAGPFPPTMFGQVSDALRTYVNITADTSLRFAALKFTPYGGR